MNRFRLVAASLAIIIAGSFFATSSVAQQPFSGKRDSIVALIWTTPPVGLVNDFDSLFTAAERRALAATIKQFTDSNGYEICIVTLRADPGIKGNLDSIGTVIANSWGVGSKTYNDGLTIVICAGCREMRITNGLGTAQVLSDPKAKGIIDTGFLPAFKRGAYYEGVSTGLELLKAALRGRRPPPMD